MKILIPFGLYECCNCSERFLYKGEEPRVVCPKCGMDLTDRAKIEIPDGRS